MHYKAIVLGSLLSTSLAACATREAEVASLPPAAPNVVTFTAVDFAFEGPMEIPAGPTTFKLDTRGQQIHHLTIVRLGEGKSVDSLLAALSKPGPPPAWATFVGGPNAPAPGAQSNATIDMTPGNYAILCFVDTPDHVPHVAKGMFRGLTVTPAVAPTAAMPEPSITMILADYAFQTDKALSAGKHLIHVKNAGPQWHEIELIKLEPGKTVEDLGAWMQSMQGPPPGIPIGGIAPVAAGGENQFEVELEAGNYVLICFLPATDGKPHFEHGMVQTITIQ